MSAARTVTVQTLDHGPVTLPEPSWCLGGHEDGGRRVDIIHQGEPVSASVDTERRGRVEFLEASFAQWPFSARPELVATVELDGHPEFGPAGLRAVAASLESHAVTLRLLADQLHGMREASR